MRRCSVVGGYTMSFFAHSRIWVQYLLKDFKSCPGYRNGRSVEQQTRTYSSKVASDAFLCADLDQSVHETTILHAWSQDVFWLIDIDVEHQEMSPTTRLTFSRANVCDNEALCVRWTDSNCLHGT